MKLADVQYWMKWAITHRDGTEPKSALALIDGNASHSNLDRLEIYSEAYFLRIHEVLEQDYALAAQAIGDEAFFSLVADYLKKYPSRYYNISDVGMNLHRYVKGHPIESAYPFLSTLVQYEHAIIEAFYADDMPALDVAHLKTIEQNDWPEMKTTLDPSVQMLSLEWNVHAPYEKKNHFLLIYRYQTQALNQVKEESISQLQYKILNWMREGLSLSEWCLALSEVTDELPPVMEWLQTWVGLGIIKRIEKKC